jgi:hypothetical protein
MTIHLPSNSRLISTVDTKEVSEISFGYWLEIKNNKNHSPSPESFVEDAEKNSL